MGDEPVRDVSGADTEFFARRRQALIDEGVLSPATPGPIRPEGHAREPIGLGHVPRYLPHKSPEDDAAHEDAGYVADTTHGTPGPREMALRLEALGDPERARNAYRLLSNGQREGIRVHLGVESHGLGGDPYVRQAAVDAVNEQAVLDKLFPEHRRARLRALTNQDVADALRHRPEPT